MEYALVIIMVFAGVGAVMLLVMAVLSMTGGQSDIAREITKDATRRKRLKNREHFLSRFYLLMTKIPFGGRYVKLVENMYYMICPYEHSYLQRLATITCIITVMLSIVGFFAVAGLGIFMEGHITLYCFACIVFLVYVIGKEVLQARISKAENQLLGELVRYIAAVKHQYYFHHDIPRAVLEASEGMQYELRRHALHMHNILSASDRAEKVKEYALSQRTNKYLKMFIVQTYSASERGDIRNKNGESLFAKNMEALRHEIKQDMRMKQKKAYKFSGYSFVAVTPIFFIEVVKTWACDFSPELTGFYAGTGNFLVVICFLATLFIYSIINKAREVNSEVAVQSDDYLQSIVNKGKMKRILDRVESSPRKLFKDIRKMLVDCGDNTSLSVFFLKMAVIGIVAFFGAMIFDVVVHEQSKIRLTTDPDGIEMVITSVNRTQIDLVCSNVLMLVKENKDKDLTVEQLSNKFEQRVPTANVSIVKAAGEEIYRRIKTYKRQYVHWYEYLACIVFGLACSFVPVVSLSYRHKLMIVGRDAEVRQFQAIILMERMFPNITIVSILEEMETFAVMFRPSIRECINSYSSGPRQALEELKQKESDHTWFVELIDGLLSADSVGIAAAFEEVENNRDSFERSKEIEAEVALDKKRDNTDFLAGIPMFLVIVVYFVGPFLINSVVDLLSMLDVMRALQNFDL